MNPALPLSLYVHLPWCVRKCPYCDFNSHGVGTAAIADRAYVAALVRDLDFDLPRLDGRRFETVFFGGGTPSLFSAEALQALFDALTRRDRLAPDAEVTLEANPGTAEAARFAAYRALGVNRLSLGIQSLDDADLAALGRIHDAGEAIHAAGIAAAAGFDNLNLDLMYGLPGQSPADAVEDLRRLLALGPAHVSWYQLTIEPNTEFHAHRPPRLPDDDAIAEMHERGAAQLQSAGFRQYEVSAWARPGRECRHNLNYWEFGDYLGIGAGAHGKLTDPPGGAVRRFARHRIPERYMRSAGTPAAIVRRTELSRSDLVIEFMLNAARLTRGFPLALFSARTGLEPDRLAPGLAQARALGLVEAHPDRVVPTELGRRHLNDLLQLFLPDGAEARASAHRRRSPPAGPWSAPGSA